MKKFLFMLYGTVVYLLFLATFCYAFGFVTELFVPKHIGSPALFPVKFPWLLNALLLGIFAIQHTSMARPAFKKWWTQYVPVPIERSTYVLITCILFIALFILWQPMGGVIWNVENDVLAGALTGVALVGGGIVLISTFLINHFDLFGLRQVWMPFLGMEYQNPKFVRRSFYNYIRHPLMFGFLVMFWATPHMTFGHLLFALLTTGYIFVALIFEERDLVKAHGEDYRSYQRQVPKIIPFTKRRVKSLTSASRESKW